MSCFSGKCDFKDHIDMVGITRTLESDIYLNTNTGKIKLDFKKEQDLIPYYGHIISMSVSNPSSCTIVLDKVPWIAREKKSINSECFIYYRNKMNDELTKYGLPLKYSNEECTPGFFMKTKELGYLMEKEELLKYSDKLFLCKDSFGNLNLLYNKYFNKTYLVAKVDLHMLNNLYSKKCTLCEVLTTSEDVYIGEYDEYSDSMILKRRKNPLKVGKIHLPKENLYYNKENKKLEV